MVWKVVRGILEVLKVCVFWIVALLAGGFALIPTSALGLSVPGQIVIPAAMILGAASSALAAIWMGNILFASAPPNSFYEDSLAVPAQRSKSRLWSVLIASEIVALVVATVFLVLAFTTFYLNSPLIQPLVLSAGVLALGSTISARLLRSARIKLARDALISVALILLAPTVVFGTVQLLCSTVTSCVP